MEILGAKRDLPISTSKITMTKDFSKEIESRILAMEGIG